MFWNLPGNPNAMWLWLILGAKEGDSFGFLSHLCPLLPWHHHLPPGDQVIMAHGSLTFTGFSFVNTVQIVHLALTGPQKPRNLFSFLFSSHFISSHCYSATGRIYLWPWVPGLWLSSERQSLYPPSDFQTLAGAQKRKNQTSCHRMKVFSSFLLTSPPSFNSEVSTSFSGWTWHGRGVEQDTAKPTIETPWGSLKLKDIYYGTRKQWP